MNSQRKKDYYEILGLERNATESQIKKNYRKLAKKYHPDISKEINATEKFKEINDAYQILSDPQKKENYDQFGHQASNFGGGASSGFDFSGFEGFQNFDFSDIFSGFGQQTKREKRTNLDLLYTMNLSFFESMEGLNKSLKFNIDSICSDCNGTGALSSSDIRKCYDCEGTGYINQHSNSIFGMLFQQKKKCRSCSGNGEIISKKCYKCRGKKIIKAEKIINVEIPKGVNTGQKIEILKKGNIDSKTKKQGNLYIQFKVEIHPIFEKIDNNDLMSVVFISYLDALLGKDIVLPTIDGEKTIELSSCTKDEKIIRLKGFGSYDPNNQKRRGDHYFKLKIKYPNKLSRKEKQALEQVLESSDYNINNEFIKELKRKKYIK